MNLAAFKRSVAQAAPPAGLAPAVEALWWDAKGDWDKAHERAQAQDDATGAWVHAYLHRKEGDRGNAGYWYRRANRPHAESELAAEWDAIATALLHEAGKAP